MKLKEFCKFQEGYVNPSQKNSSYFDGNIKWIRATDLNNTYVFNTSRTLSKEGFQSAGKSAKLFRPDTICISKSGTIGRLGILKDYMCGNRAIINIDIDTNKMNMKYVFYWLMLNRDYIQNLSVGSVQKNLYISSLEDLQIEDIPLGQQDKIVSILSSLDDKIELNNEINKTLEEMAQAIFKSWFVDFEPFRDGEFEESELGMIPKGWRIGCVSDLCDVLSSKRIFMSDYRTEGVPFYRGKEIIEKAKGNDISTEIYIEENKFNEIKEKFGSPQKGDILLTSVGTIGVPYLVKNEEFYFKDGNLTWFKDFKLQEYNYYLYYWIKFGEGKSNIDKITIGSTQKALTISSLKGMKIIIPNEKDIKRFATHIELIIQRYEKNITESNLLKNIRDTLLPKLISGQIKL